MQVEDVVGVENKDYDGKFIHQFFDVLWTMHNALFSRFKGNIDISHILIEVSKPPHHFFLQLHGAQIESVCVLPVIKKVLFCTTSMNCSPATKVNMCMQANSCTMHETLAYDLHKDHVCIYFCMCGQPRPQIPPIGAPWLMPSYTGSI